MEKEIYIQWMKRVESDKTMVRRLSRYLDDPVINKVLAKQSHTDSELLKLYRKLLAEQKQSGREVEDIIEEWLASSEDAALKGEFLLAGVGGDKFKRYLELIPKNQHDAVWEKVDAESSLSVYLNFAKENNLEEKLLTRAVLKSFELQEIAMPGGHRFEIQRTPETQIKWEAIMGGNPSVFKGDNRPVEQCLLG